MHDTSMEIDPLRVAPPADGREEAIKYNYSDAEERVESGMVKEVVSRQQQTEDTHTHLSITR